MSKDQFKYDSIDESSGFILFKLNLIWKEKLDTIFKKRGITQTQYAILASLMWFDLKKEIITQQDLADHLKIEKMTLSKAIRNLEEKKLVQRKENKIDTRSYSLSLLAAGKQLAEKVIKEVENLDEVFFNVLSKEERKKFNSLSLKLITLNLK